MKHLKKKSECPYCKGKSLLTEENTKITYSKGDINMKVYFYKCQNCGKDHSTIETEEKTIREFFQIYL